MRKVASASPERLVTRTPFRGAADLYGGGIAAQDRGRLDLDLCLGFQQPGDHDDRHRGEVATHDGAVRRADLARVREVLVAVGDVPGQPDDVLGARARLGEHGEHVAQRLARLAGEVAMREGAGLVPADHPAREDDAVRLDPVRVALGLRPAGRLQGPHRSTGPGESPPGRLLPATRAPWASPSPSSRSTVRWTLPVGVRGSASRNSTRRGYLYGAILAFTWSCSSFAVTGALLITNALTTWPRSSSGAATTAHSETAGCSSSAASTSKPEML